MSIKQIKRTVLFLLLMGVGVCSLKAQDAVILQDSKQEITGLGGKLQYYVEQPGEYLQIETITADGWDKWTPNPALHLNLGYTKTPIWLRVHIRNSSSYERWLMVLDNAFPDSISYYVNKNGKWEVKHTGASFPYKTRGVVEHNAFAHYLDLASGEEQTYYLRIANSSSSLLPIYIAKEHQVYHNNLTRHVGYGVYFGVLLVMIVYNLFIFFVLRDNSYLFYTLTIIATILVFSSISGFLFKYIHPNIPALNTWLIRGSMAGTVVTTSLFAIYFLETKRYSMLLHRLFLTTIIIAMVAFGLNMMGWSGLINKIISAQTFLLLIGGIYCWRVGNKGARLFVVAWATYTVGGLMITLRNSGSLPINFWTNHGAEIGSALEVVLISIALADKYRLIRREKDAATKKALEVEQQAKQELEQKVRERTLALRESNEELSQINEELAVTLEALEQQKAELQSNNIAISDSISYAKRIQEAILPTDEVLGQFLTTHFVLYQPRDVVSGDFYFFLKTETHHFLAVADCTGHGVPGAMMSMIGVNLLRSIILEKQITSPAQILDTLHENITVLLKQKASGNRDGMDLGICVWAEGAQVLDFAGAKTPLLYIQDNTLYEVKGSKFGVGGLSGQTPIYEEYQIKLQQNTQFYLASDGYQDQFGGKEDRKFMRNNFKKLLKKIAFKNPEIQKEILVETLTEWQAPLECPQVDDILVLGFTLEPQSYKPQ
ncbi:7TM diverse intracellular signaling domain-containing protein [Eisenibacter elegans]|uniref:7TM diverse intracellular signaling domain-containing protein n=1 Tax=Eisenibacter elegans TaxID=997 RepID=UPI0009D77865|nr:7TM diverse intracellular signaling domain-containing protein [Eisenibacter elegans]